MNFIKTDQRLNTIKALMYLYYGTFYLYRSVRTEE